MAQYIFGEEEPPLTTAVSGVSMEYLIMPLVRKVIDGTNKPLVDAKAFFWFCKDFIRDKADHYEKMRAFWVEHYIDTEAVLVSELADYAIKVIKSSDENDEDL